MRFLSKVDTRSGKGVQRCLTQKFRRGITATMLIYKIFHTPEWATLQQDGETSGAPIDIADGFVHFSTAAQVSETAAKHFAGADDLVLLAIDSDTMGDKLKWEVSRGGDLFPHLYRNLTLDEVLWSRPLPFAGGKHQFPDELT